MMRYLFLVLILALLPYLGFAQDFEEEVQKLHTELASTKSCEKKVRALISLCKLYQFEDYTKTLNYANEALSRSQKCNYTIGEADANYFIGFANTDLGNFNRSLEGYLKALDKLPVWKGYYTEALAALKKEDNARRIDRNVTVQEP